MKHIINIINVNLLAKECWVNIVRNGYIMAKYKPYIVLYWKILVLALLPLHWNFHILPIPEKKLRHLIANNSDVKPIFLQY